MMDMSPICGNHLCKGKTKMTFMTILPVTVAAVAAAAPLAEYPGEVGENAGWKCVGSEERMKRLGAD